MFEINSASYNHTCLDDLKYLTWMTFIKFYITITKFVISI